MLNAKYTPGTCILIDTDFDRLSFSHSAALVGSYQYMTAYAIAAIKLNVQV